MNRKKYNRLHGVMAAINYLSKHCNIDTEYTVDDDGDTCVYIWEHLHSLFGTKLLAAIYIDNVNVYRIHDNIMHIGTMDKKS